MILNEQLPSRAKPYNVKSITVSALKPKHMIAFSEAVVSGNLTPAIRAIGETIDFDVNELTFGDFYYLFTLQRFEFRKLPFNVSWECDGLVYQAVHDKELIYTREQCLTMLRVWNSTEDKVGLTDPYKLTVAEINCDQTNTDSISIGDFETLYLEEEIDDPRLDYPRVSILAEFQQLQSDQVLKGIANIACWVKEGRTLRDKIKILESQETFELFDAAYKAANKYQHGIGREITKQCEFCREPHKFAVSIGPSSFLV